MTPKVINAAPSLEKAELYGIHDQRPTFSKLMGLAGRIFIETIPQWLTVAAMLSLIFGGCCSNVSPGRVSFRYEDMLQIHVFFSGLAPRQKG